MSVSPGFDQYNSDEIKDYFNVFVNIQLCCVVSEFKSVLFS